MLTHVRILNSKSRKMLIKIATIALMAFIATVEGREQRDCSSGNKVWNGFTASWALNISTRFYDLPQTLKAAENEGWTFISGVNPPKGITPRGYYGDPTFVVLFKNGKAMGFQLAMPVEAFRCSTQPILWAENDAIITKTLNRNLYYTATAYFYSDESGDVRKLWFQGKSGLREIPTDASLITSKTRFLLKKCIPAMGVHYYTWNRTTDCATLDPWLLLSHEGDTIGVGFQGFGNLAAIGKRKWWDVIPAGAIYATMDDPPQCAVDGTAEYGTISIHVWFLYKPQIVTTCN